MISVFDTNPVIFESNDRTLTISYNGVLCKNANGQVITDIDFEDVNELYLTRYLNSNSNYTIMFRDHNWKNIEGQDLDTDRTESNAGHNIREIITTRRTGGLLWPYKGLSLVVAL